MKCGFATQEAGLEACPQCRVVFAKPQKDMTEISKQHLTPMPIPFPNLRTLRRYASAVGVGDWRMLVN
jgi:hypothetical protein